MRLTKLSMDITVFLVALNPKISTEIIKMKTVKFCSHAIVEQFNIVFIKVITNNCNTVFCGELMGIIRIF